MKVLVTGAFGLVGRQVVSRLLAEGHEVRIFDRPDAGRIERIIRSASRPMRKVIRKLLRNASARRPLETVRGDLCNIADVGEAVKGVDAVIHLGAMIPPAADVRPGYARYVNLGGTQNVIRALKDSANDALLVYSSSVAVYGDRLENPMIKTSDAPRPNATDYYAQQKLAAEECVRVSGLRHVIFRLTAIVSPEKLKLDPLMFEMPLATSLEVCSARDTAAGIVAAIRTPEAEGKLLHLAGGEACRTTFGEYMHSMLEIMGLRGDTLPNEAFSSRGYHCGYMDTTDAQALLGYQHDTLDDYYREVRAAVRWRRIVFRILRPVVRPYLLRRSHYWIESRPKLQARFGSSIGRKRAHLPA